LLAFTLDAIDAAESQILVVIRAEQRGVDGRTGEWVDYAVGLSGRIVGAAQGERASVRIQ
jgi:hypothetical protein